MNIIKSISLTPDKPAVLSIRKAAKSNYFAVGLVKDQILKEHKTAVPALLTVLKGSIEFRMDGKTHILKKYDTFSIPENVLHEVHGRKKKNIFTILK